jgi:hypothetical protein
MSENQPAPRNSDAGHSASSLIQWTNADLYPPHDNDVQHNLAARLAPYVLLISYDDGELLIAREGHSDAAVADAYSISMHGGVNVVQVHNSPDSPAPTIAFSGGKCVYHA